MFVHLPIVIMATFAPVAVSDTVPKFDITKECRFENGPSADDHCSKDEDVALKQLQNSWTQFTVGDKKTCIASTTIGGFASYVDLLTCLQMARDARNESNPAQGRQSTDAMRPHAPGETVGVGPDPTTSGRTPGQGNH